VSYGASQSLQAPVDAPRACGQGRRPSLLREHPFGLEDEDREGSCIRVFGAVAGGRDLDAEKLGHLHHQAHKLVVPAKGRLSPFRRKVREEDQGSLAGLLQGHDCVEGWTAIGKWTGVPLGLLLHAAGLRPDARYAVFHCADDYEQSLDGSGRYYESIDLIDALHPQTILAYGMNGQELPVAHGAPLRLRVERQLGYKHAKYVMRIEVLDSFQSIGRGKGGFWEDRGYEWYAGI
jgi:hypothetical protein